MFDTRNSEIKGHITSIIGIVGEDLGAALFKHYYERNHNGKASISDSSPKSGGRKGPRLDRWIYVAEKQKTIAYQTEIKN